MAVQNNENFFIKKKYWIGDIEPIQNGKKILLVVLPKEEFAAISGEGVEASSLDVEGENGIIQIILLQEGFLTLETLIHECGHAAFYYIEDVNPTFHDLCFEEEEMAQEDKKREIYCEVLGLITSKAIEIFNNYLNGKTTNKTIIRKIRWKNQPPN